MTDYNPVVFICQAVFLIFFKYYPNAPSTLCSPVNRITRLWGRHTMGLPPSQKPRFMQYPSGQSASITAILPPWIHITLVPFSVSTVSCRSSDSSTVSNSRPSDQISARAAFSRGKRSSALQIAAASTPANRMIHVLVFKAVTCPPFRIYGQYSKL